MLSHILSSLFRKGTGSPRPSELPTMSPWHALRKRGCGRPPFWLRHHWSHGNCQWVVHGRRDWFWRHFLYWLQEPWVCFSPGSMLNLRQFLVLKLCHGSQGNFFFSESPPNSKIDNFGLIYVHTDLGSLIGSTQCGNSRIFLPLGFCVKLFLIILKGQKVPFWPFKQIWILKFWKFLTCASVVRFSQNQFKASKIIKMTDFKLQKSAKIDFT